MSVSTCLLGVLCEKVLGVDVLCVFPYFLVYVVVPRNPGNADCHSFSFVKSTPSVPLTSGLYNDDLILVRNTLGRNGPDKLMWATSFSLSNSQFLHLPLWVGTMAI